MDDKFENRQEDEAAPVRQLTKGQRRVLGVLIEKAFTTPDQYPLTLKAATSGANQKSNRDPVTNFTEAAIWDLLDELRQLGLTAVVHTESGRTERFRHYARKRFPFNEPQLAIMTELMLRGKQQLGELRSRASRMVPIESLDELRKELTSLQEQGYLQANGPLERRGIEVDHNLYPESEQMKLAAAVPTAPLSSAPSAAPAFSGGESVHQTAGSAANPDGGRVEKLREEVMELRSEVESLRQTVDNLKDDLNDLRRSLGA